MNFFLSSLLYQIGISSLGMSFNYYYDDSNQAEQVSTKRFYHAGPCKAQLHSSCFLASDRNKNFCQLQSSRKQCEITKVQDIQIAIFVLLFPFSVLSMNLKSMSELTRSSVSQCQKRGMSVEILVAIPSKFRPYSLGQTCKEEFAGLRSFSSHFPAIK